MKINLSKFLSLSIILITVSSINQWTSLPIGNTILWWCIYSCILMAFLKAKYTYYNNENNKYIIPLLLYLTWNVICIIRGIWIAENYWEWKNLVGTGMVLLLPISIYISTNKFILQNIIGTWVKYALPGFLIFLPFFTSGDALGRYLVPVSFILLFFPLLSNKWKVLIILCSLFVIFAALDARSNVIKFGLSFLFGSLYYFRSIISNNILNVARLCLLITPILLFALATMGSFNIFKMDEYIGEELTTTVVNDGEIQEESLTADTRTLLYEEVLFSALKNDYVLTGRTPARGNDSELFGLVLAEELQTGKMERFNNEVSILNIFTWTGVIGVILYFFIFFHASYLAINKSNNSVIKITGTYIAFRWAYAWVEDFSNFDLSYFFLWVMIGMCFSRSFRAMNDLEMRLWIHGIFYNDIKLNIANLNKVKFLNMKN